MQSSTSRLWLGLSASIRRSLEPTLARQPPVETIIATTSTQPARLIHKTSQAYCPIYSILNEPRGRARPAAGRAPLAGPVWSQQRSLANKSSQYFAPSSIRADHHRAASHEPRGILSVYEHSDHLPALPVPHLEVTLERLKETIWPMAMNSAEFASTLHLIERFAKFAGPKLDKLLRLKAQQTKNWVTHDWWVREVYLKSRAPLVINSNPSMIFPTLPFEVGNQRVFINTVAQMISGIIDYKLALENGYNPEATNSDNEFHLDPYLCYDQYKNIFGSIRVPGDKYDTFLKPKSVPQSSQCANSDSVDSKRDTFNLIISFRGSFFEIQLKDIEDESTRIGSLTKILDKLVDSVDSANFEQAAGVLTAAKRDQWAKAYRLLDETSLESLRDAQFIVCIDTVPNEHPDAHLEQLINSPIGSEQHLASLARQILHGDRLNVGNRWFDKPIQLIVVADENAERLIGAGINYEHCMAEGVVVSKMIEYSYDKVVQRHREQKDNMFTRQQVAHEPNCPAVFRQLAMFNESHMAAIGDNLKQAKQDFISQVNQFGLSCMNYKHYGANAIKSWHFSPDSWLQVALQLAYYNLHKRPGPCYETASTRRFAYGRTETIRSLTKDVAEFCLNPQYETMQAAVASHKSYANAANNGEAIDRVLMGYRLVFNELRSNTWAWGLPDVADTKSSPMEAKHISQLDAVFDEKDQETLSAFFNSALIERSRRFALSTSQVSSIHPNIFMTYGPLLADGYGCCYNITGQQIVAAITANSLNQSFSCDVNDLNASLRDSLDQMRDLVAEGRS